MAFFSGVRPRPRQNSPFTSMEVVGGLMMWRGTIIRPQQREATTVNHHEDEEFHQPYHPKDPSDWYIHLHLVDFYGKCLPARPFVFTNKWLEMISYPLRKTSGKWNFIKILCRFLRDVPWQKARLLRWKHCQLLCKLKVNGWVIFGRTPFCCHHGTMN